MGEELQLIMTDPFTGLIAGVLLATLGMILFLPNRGLIHRWRGTQRLSSRVLSEDALKHIHHCEIEEHAPSLHSIAGALGITTNRTVEVLAKLERLNLVRVREGVFCLTPTGRDEALRIIRAHRLWERYLAEETGFAPSDWHPQAEQHEHLLSAEDVQALSAQLGNPTHDPHGDPIPTAQGEMIPQQGIPLTTAPIDQPVQIVHIEDEPQVVYDQIVAEGLYPGAVVRVTATSPQRIHFWSNGNEHVLAPTLANNLTVLPLTQGERPDPEPGMPLSSLNLGQRGKLVSISRSIRGAERRRLLDLGLLPGTIVEAELRSPTGDPTAYRIRGAVIALRNDQADLILIEPQVNNHASRT